VKSRPAFCSSQGKLWDENLGITVKPLWGNTVGTFDYAWALSPSRSRGAVET